MKMEYDFCKVTAEEAEQLNPLVLAYIGDAVFEMYVRLHIVGNGRYKTNTLHKMSIAFVSAKAQAKILDRISEQLTEKEKEIIRRGRNAHANTIPKNATIADYKKATAFEALIGYLFLTKNEARLAAIIGMAFEEEA